MRTNVGLGAKFLYGVCLDKPALPGGWHYEEEKDCWLFAVSPTGDYYYVQVEPQALIPRRISRRNHFADTLNPLPF